MLLIVIQRDVIHLRNIIVITRRAKARARAIAIAIATATAAQTNPTLALALHRNLTSISTSDMAGSTTVALTQDDTIDTTTITKEPMETAATTRVDTMHHRMALHSMVRWDTAHSSTSLNTEQQQLRHQTNTVSQCTPFRSSFTQMTNQLIRSRSENQSRERLVRIVKYGDPLEKIRIWEVENKNYQP